MLHLMMTAGFKDIIETDNITLDIGIGIGDTVTDTRLGGKIYDNRDFVFRENFLYHILVGNRGTDKSPVTV